MTGSRGPISSTARTAHGNVRKVVAQDTARMPAPPPRLSWTPETADAWITFWGSPLAAAVAPVDLPQILALYDLIDTRAILLANIATEGATVVGSRGQPALHPGIRAVANLSTQLNALADRFMLSPGARARLGVDYAGGASAADSEAARIARILDGPS